MHDTLDTDRGSRRGTLSMYYDRPLRNSVGNPPSCMNHPRNWVAGPWAQSDQEGHEQKRAGSTAAMRQAALGLRFERFMLARIEE